MNLLTAIVPDMRRSLKDGRYPLKLRVTYQRERRYYTISFERRKGVNFHVTHAPEKSKKTNGKEMTEWDRVNTDSPRGRYRDIKLLIPELLNEADELIRTVIPFSFEKFDLLYNGDKKEDNLFSVFAVYIAELKSQGRISTASSYDCALNSLKGYDAKADFHTVTPEFLRKYQSWMAENDRSTTTTGIYLRSLRTIFNIARKQKLTANYPFDEYNIPSSENIKKALDINDIGKLLNYKTIPLSAADRAKDLWIFSYFSNGMNIKDICSLTIRDIDIENMTITYIREKTRRTNRTEKKIEVDIVKETLDIIVKWGKLDGEKNEYIFPFFYKGITPEQKRAVTQNIVKQTNKYINVIRKDVGITIRIGTYHARHSFANVLKQSGAPLEFISESMGHADMKTTENYLKSFSSEYRKKWGDAINPNKQAQ